MSSPPEIAPQQDTGPSQSADTTTLALMLAGLAMLGPFSIDTYLPAFPNIQASLHASAIEVQQTLTAYMFSFAVMILWHGALSDAFGRRNIILGSLAVFAVATLGCAVKHSVEYLSIFGHSACCRAYRPAPVFVTQHLKLGPGQFGWLFVPSVPGIFFGALTANRLAGRISILRQVRIGFVLLITAALANVLYHAFLPPMLPWSIVPLFFYTFGMSMVAPGATLMMLDLFPAIRGIVASCQSFTLTMLGALVAGVIAPILSHSVLWLAAG